MLFKLKAIFSAVHANTAPIGLNKKYQMAQAITFLGCFCRFCWNCSDGACGSSGIGDYSSMSRVSSFCKFQQQLDKRVRVPAMRFKLQ